MSIRAVFLPGQTHVTVNGLYQWDYGRELEIQAEDIAGAVEVHFACAGVEEAEVTTCVDVNGNFTVAIPDKYLEQTAPITAWVYLLDSTSGSTVYTITMPITARVRPKLAGAQPTKVGYTKYEDALAGFNEAVDDLRSGVVTVAKATEADEAQEAGHAKSADVATKDANGAVIHETYLKNGSTVEWANHSNVATQATQDKNGAVIHETYLTQTQAAETYVEKVPSNLRLIQYERDTTDANLEQYMPNKVEKILGFDGYTGSRDILDRIRHVSAVLYARRDEEAFECKFNGVNYAAAEEKNIGGQLLYGKDFYMTMVKTDGVTQKLRLNDDGDDFPSFCIGDATMRVLCSSKGVLSFYFLTDPTMITPGCMMAINSAAGTDLDAQPVFMLRKNPTFTRVERVSLCVDGV